VSIASFRAQKKINLLWVDDQVSDFGAHIDSLRESGFAVTAVAGADEALSTIRHRAFDVIIVDLKMHHDDGIDLLRDLSPEIQASPGTKVVVLSSFLYESVIRNRLIDLNMNLALLEKTGSRRGSRSQSLAERLFAILDREDSMLPASDQFSQWDQIAQAFDPFNITYEKYLESPMVARRQLDRDAATLTRDARARLRERGIVWALFCGSPDEPISFTTEDGEVPSDEHILALASSRGHPPYEFFSQGEYEEYEPIRPSKASSLPNMLAQSTGCIGSPDYPYFRIRVVRHHNEDVSINRSRDFHFDTGLDVTAFAIETALKIGLEVETARPAKFIVYKEYEDRDLAFYPTLGKAVVERGDRGTLDVAIVGRAYLDWGEAPFSRHCREFDCSSGDLCHRRHALLGRNLLVENGLELDVRQIGI
jgi:CheY-like chemotaxis protein